MRFKTSLVETLYSYDLMRYLSVIEIYVISPWPQPVAMTRKGERLLRQIHGSVSDTSEDNI